MKPLCLFARTGNFKIYFIGKYFSKYLGRYLLFCLDLLLQQYFQTKNCYRNIGLVKRRFSALCYIATRLASNRWEYGTVLHVWALCPLAPMESQLSLCDRKVSLASSWSALLSDPLTSGNNQTFFKTRLWVFFRLRICNFIVTLQMEGSG